MSRMQVLSVWNLDVVCFGCRTQSSRPRVQDLAKAQQRAAASSKAVSVAVHDVVEVNKRLGRRRSCRVPAVKGNTRCKGARRNAVVQVDEELQPMIAVLVAQKVYRREW